MRCFLAFNNDSCIGYSVVLIDHEDNAEARPRQAELVNMFVSDGFRSLYIGRHLMNATLFHLKVSSRCRKCVCLVEANNPGACTFMHALGFVEIMKNDRGGGEKFAPGGGELTKSGYSTLIESIRARHRSTYVYFRVLNFYYLFLEFDLVKFK